MKNSNYNTGKPKTKWIPLPCDGVEDPVESEFLPMTFDEDICKKLPPIFQEVIQQYKDKNQQDVAMSSLLTLLSSILPNVYVIHGNSKHALNLSLFIIANAGSGKGVMVKTQKLFLQIEVYINEKNKLELQEWQEASKDASENGGTPPAKPQPKSLYCPANSSYAAFLEELVVNDGRLTIFESEADTLTGTLRQDWSAGYSEGLRQSFHHEPIKCKRKGKEQIVISFPCISILFSGTPNQFFKLIPNAENGLMSRILFYYFKGSIEWDDTIFASESWQTVEEKNSKIGLVLLELFKYVENKEQVIFIWEKIHQEKLNKYFSSELTRYDKFVGTESNAIIKRLGLIASRIAATISTVRSFQELGSIPNIITSTDDDLEIAMHFISAFTEHSITMLDKIAKPSLAPITDSGKTCRMTKLYDKLPGNFQRYKAINIGVELGFAERTTDHYLKKLVEKKLLNKSNLVMGEYDKPDHVYTDADLE